MRALEVKQSRKKKTFIILLQGGKLVAFWCKQNKSENNDAKSQHRMKLESQNGRRTNSERAQNSQSENRTFSIFSCLPSEIQDVLKSSGMETTAFSFCSNSFCTSDSYTSAMFPRVFTVSLFLFFFIYPESCVRMSRVSSESDQARSDKSLRIMCIELRSFYGNSAYTVA